VQCAQLLTPYALLIYFVSFVFFVDGKRFLA